MKRTDWNVLGPDVVRLRLQGLTRKEICIQLNIAPNALKKFLQRPDHSAPIGVRIKQIKPPALRNAPPKSMTETQIKQLTALWSEGHTASEIGRLMDISKNAVIGRVHRLGLPARPSPIIRGTRPSDPPEQHPIEQTTPPPPSLSLSAPVLPAHIEPDPIEPEVIAPPAEIIRIIPVQTELAHPPPPQTVPAHKGHGMTCRWPIGEPKTKAFRYCDAANVVEGKSYCLEHCQQAYVNFGRGNLKHAA